jgi:hypothetical protein
VFKGTLANGVWQLFVRDDSAVDLGTIADGWQLSITTENLVITSQPMGLSAGLDGTARLSVGAAGMEPLMYQWRLNGAILPAATNWFLILSNLQVADFGTYSVTVANDFGAITSEQVPLQLDATPLAAADDFAASTPLDQDSGLIRGMNLFASIEPGEPNHAGKRSSKSVWYERFAHNSGVATFSTKGSGFDTLLAVYTGNDVRHLTEVARDEDRGGFFTSTLRFNAVEGQTYRIAVDGFGGREGFFLLQWSLDAGAPPLPVILAHPSSQSVQPGGSATLSVGATGNGLTYQWSFFGTEIPGAVNATLSRFNVQAGDVGAYTVRVRNREGQLILSETALIEIGPILGIQSLDKFEDLSTPTSGMSPFLSVRAGQSTLSQVLNNTDGLTSSREANHCGVSPSFTRWIGFAPEDDGEFEIDTKGSSLPAMVAVYTVFDGTRLDEVACDRSDPDSRPCYVRFPATPGTNYYVVVDGLRGLTGPIQVNWQFGVHLSIARADPNVVLSWMAPTGTYQLCSTPELTNPPGTNIWSSVTNAVIFNGGSNRVAVPLPGGIRAKAFRLHKR